MLLLLLLVVLVQGPATELAGGAGSCADVVLL
jgi:hypothetical protein